MVKRFVILLCFFSFVIPIKAAKNHAELQINENLLKSIKKKSFKKLQKDLKIVQLRPTQQLFKTRLRKWNQRIQITISISLYTPLV